MSTAERRARIDASRCIICQQALDRHSMKVKVDGRVRRICNRVDREHAEWLLDRKMDMAYLRITSKRRGGLMGIVVLVMAFVVLIWAFTYTTGFKTLFVAAASVISLAIAVFVLSEMRAITVHDRMRGLVHEVEMERPIASPASHPSMERLDEVAALVGEAEPEQGRVAIHAAAEPAPTRASARAAPPPEDGIPGMPQPVIAPDEWQVMSVEGPEPASPTPQQTFAATPSQAPGVPPPAVPASPVIEDLPDEAGPSPAPAPAPAPLSPPAPVQAPPSPAPPARYGPPPSQPAPRAPAPPAPAPPARAPPAPTPPVPAPPAPPPPWPPAQAPVPPPAAPPSPPAAPQGPPPSPPQAPQPPQRPRPQAGEEDVEEVEWVDWE